MRILFFNNNLILISCSICSPVSPSGLGNFFTPRTKLLKLSSPEQSSEQVFQVTTQTGDIVKEQSSNYQNSADVGDDVDVNFCEPPEPVDPDANFGNLQDEANFGELQDEDDDFNAIQDVLGPPAEQKPPEEILHQLVPGPSDLSQSPNEGPTHIFLRKYPSHAIGNIERRFNSKWYEMHTWLEYSRVTDSAYCFYCRHFAFPTRQDRRHEIFTHSGFRAWNRCVGSDPKSNAFLLHKNSDEHRGSCERHEAYKAMSDSGKTVVALLNTEHKKQVSCFDL